jgi:hypothetical protein
MDTWISTLGVIGLFILRLGVPLAITLAIGYWLRRLDAKWQAEAQAQRPIAQGVQPSLGDGSLIAKEKEVLGLGETSGERGNLSLKSFRINAQPCWLIKDCPESIRLSCPAYQYPYLACWMARYRATGQIPPQCYNCDLFPLSQTPQKV